VFGQGGITPDYKVAFTNKLFTFSIQRTGTFFTYARKFVTKKTDISKLYVFPDELGDKNVALKGKKVLDENFVVDTLVLEDFKAYLKELDFSYKPEDFEDALEEIKREIKREIFSSLWGVERGWKVLMENDPVVKKAIEVLPESEALLKKTLR